MRPATAFILTGFLIGSPVAAQPHNTSGHNAASPGTGSEPMGAYQVRAYGAFRLFMQKQDYSPKVSLEDARTTGATDGVGAASGLRGEITLIDGRYVVSYGGGCKGECPSPHTEAAGLLGTGQVKNWHSPILVPERLVGKALEDFVTARAKAKGIDLERPFPVRLKGTLVDVQMHVIEAPNPAFTGHGSKMRMAKQDEFTHAQIAGEIVGIYAPSTMHGIVTHPGERFHFHWIDVTRTRTAHLDAFGMEKGAELLLPKD
jgi:hypothetical protein